VSDLFDEQSDEGIEAQRRCLESALAAAGLTEEEVEAFLRSLEVADLAELAFVLGRPPGQVRRVFQSAFRKILETGLVGESDLPEVVGLWPD